MRNKEQLKDFIDRLKSLDNSVLLTEFAYVSGIVYLLKADMSDKYKEVIPDQQLYFDELLVRLNIRFRKAKS